MITHINALFRKLPVAIYKPHKAHVFIFVEYLSIPFFHGLVKFFLKLSCRYTFHAPQTEKHKLRLLFFFSQFFRLLYRFLSTADSVLIICQSSRIGPSFMFHAGSGSQSQTEIISSLPVFQIVDTFLSFFGIIGYFIPVIPMPPQDLFRKIVHLPVCVLIHRRIFPYFS